MSDLSRLKKQSVHRSPSPAEVFGERLRELRTNRRLTQQRLADLVGIPHTHVSAIERGVKLPTLLTVLRLAVALVTVFDRADLDAIVGSDRRQ